MAARNYENLLTNVEVKTTCELLETRRGAQETV